MYNWLRKSQVFWDVLAKLSAFYPCACLKKFPRNLIIELTNSCNLRCPVCPTHFAMKREKGFMDFDLFKSIIDEFNGFKIKPKISMNFAGEPLLHENACEFVRYANSKGHKTFISTNATALTKDLSKKLIEYGLDSIHLCIDGITKKSHEAYRVGSKFEVVKKNIEDFILTRESLGKSRPSVSIQTLLTSFSENEMDQIIEWAKDIGADKVNFKSLSMGSYTTKQMREQYGYLLPEKEKLRRGKTGIYKTVCTSVLNHAVVYWNGDLGLCCVDFNNVVKLPNIKEKGFIKTFISEEVVQKRKSGLRKRFDLCKKCSLANADFMGVTVDLNKASRNGKT